jgi:hypothetical protein
MDQLLTCRRRQARRLLLLRMLRILLVITVATVIQAALPYIVSRELAFADPGFDERYMIDGGGE